MGGSNSKYWISTSVIGGEVPRERKKTTGLFFDAWANFEVVAVLGHGTVVAFAVLLADLQRHVEDEFVVAARRRARRRRSHGRGLGRRRFRRRRRTRRVRSRLATAREIGSWNHVSGLAVGLGGPTLVEATCERPGRNRTWRVARPRESDSGRRGTGRWPSRPSRRAGTWRRSRTRPAFRPDPWRSKWCAGSGSAPSPGHLMLRTTYENS